MEPHSTLARSCTRFTTKIGSSGNTADVALSPTYRVVLALGSNSVADRMSPNRSQDRNAGLFAQAYAQQEVLQRPVVVAITTAE